MALCVCAALLASSLVSSTQGERLIAHWTGDGTPEDALGMHSGKIIGNVSFVPGVHGQAFRFDGRSGGVLIPDSDDFTRSRSFTISAWVYVNKLPHDGSSPNGQIFFRGDDRNGLDSFYVCVVTDGSLVFGINGPKGEGTDIRFPVPMKRWFLVEATHEAGLGRMRLWVDHIRRAQTYIQFRPIVSLDPGSGPGLAIGNVQRPQAGIHWQPFDGMIDDIRFYEGVLAQPSDEPDQGLDAPVIPPF